ncbi:MAG: tRNA pseudouridine synthase B [Parcubacteria group bacterium GW2011_GWC2_42_11]|nr:MAG: tRNA pseudouridine synthase B [Parcubacteria group bacterium GW2011_GWC2_42_11]
MPEIPQGIILIDKPLGITSFDVVRSLRKELKVKKIGHAGTLDPLASGLMILGVEAGTKLLHAYQMLPKIYESEICVGERTTTSDKEGKVLESCVVDELDTTIVKKELHEMQGVLRLPVSIYSAMKKGGEEFYKKARRGEHPVPPVRDMEVFEANLVEVCEKRDERMYLRVTFSVGSGTYIRSLAEELGRRLGYPARLENLRRVQVGDFRVEQARELNVES